MLADRPAKFHELLPMPLSGIPLPEPSPYPSDSLASVVKTIVNRQSDIVWCCQEGHAIVEHARLLRTLKHAPALMVLSNGVLTFDLCPLPAGSHVVTPSRLVWVLCSRV
jgi:hypothetical protein